MSVREQKEQRNRWRAWGHNWGTREKLIKEEGCDKMGVGGAGGRRAGAMRWIIKCRYGETGMPGVFERPNSRALRALQREKMMI